MSSPTQAEHTCKQCGAELPPVKNGLNWLCLSERRTENFDEYGDGATYFCNYLCICKYLLIQCPSPVKTAQAQLVKDMKTTKT